VSRQLLVGLVVSLAVCSTAQAATWSVDSTADTPVGQQCPSFTGCSLRQAVTSSEANGGSDAILVSAGTYTLTNGELSVSQDLTVSRVGAGVSTVSGNAAGRIFNVTGAGTDLVLRFMTLTAGAATGGGGAILGAAGTTIGLETTTITDSHATDSAAARGGAIYSQGSVSIGPASGSTAVTSITGNSAIASGTSGDARGGAVAVTGGGALTVTGPITITGNDAISTGASGLAFGGALYGDGGVTITRATLSGNDVSGASAGGGAVAGSAGTISATRSTFNANTVTATAADGVAAGGAIEVPSGGSASVELAFSTVSGNSATTTNAATARASGGGIANLGVLRPITLTSSTVAGNSTSVVAGTASGGGVHVNSGTVTIAGSILAENTQGALATQCAAGAITSTGYSVLGDVSSCTYSAGTGDVTGVSDAGIAVLGSYGGLTTTRMLELGSPALDLIPAGDALCTSSGFDQRGSASAPLFTRPQAGNCDAGSVEARPATLTITPDPRSFADTAVSQSSTANVSVSNGGDLAMAVPPEASVAAPFSYVSGCTSAVGANANCIMSLRFAPVAEGAANATLTVSAGSLSDTGTLNGTGLFGNTARPVLTGAGAPRPGDAITTDDGAWSSVPDTITRAWQRCDADGSSNCDDLAGETAGSYVVTDADLGKTLRSRITATSGVASQDAFSAAGGVVTAPAPAGGDGGTPPESGGAGAGGGGGSGSQGGGGGHTPTDVFGIPLTPDCELAGAVMLDVHRVGKRVSLGGLAPVSAAGRKVTIRADRGGGRVTATVRSDGSFAAPNRSPRGRNSGAIRYAATLDGVTSSGLRLDRRFLLLSKRTTTAGVALRARVVGGRKGLKVTLRRALPCTGREERRTLRLGRGGILTAVLPRPTATEKLAFYRVYTDLPKFPVWTLPIVVRAS
jgi:hypothetical protein